MDGTFEDFRPIFALLFLALMPVISFYYKNAWNIVTKSSFVALRNESFPTLNLYPFFFAYKHIYTIVVG